MGGYGAGAGYGYSAGYSRSYGSGFQGASAGYSGSYGSGFQGAYGGPRVQQVHGGQVYGGVQSVVQSPELIQAREKSQAMWAEVNSKRGNSGAYSAAGHHGGYAAAHSGYAGAH